MSKTCSVCGATLEDNASFCTVCGSPVAEEPVQESSGAETPVQESSVAETPAQDTPIEEKSNPYSIPANSENMAQPDSTPGINLNQAETVQTKVQPNVNQAYSNPNIQDTSYQNDAYYAQAGGYGAGMVQEPVKKDPTGLGVASIICSVLGLLGSCCGGGLLFGLIGLILGIVYAIKAKKKGLGIAGIIVGALGLIISGILVIMILAAPAAILEAMENAGIDTDEIQDILDQELNNPTTTEWDYGLTTTEWEWTEDGYSTEVTTEDEIVLPETVTDTNQMMIDGKVYTIPCALNNGLYVDLSGADKYSAKNITIFDEISTNGIAPGEYKFVSMYDDKGNSFWGFVENTGTETIKDVSQLQVTGLNVDSYSFSQTCTAEVYQGVKLGMSKEEIEGIIGVASETNENGYLVYENADGSYVLAVEYDETNTSIALELTYYQ